MPDILMADGAVWFSVPAILGTLFFAIRMVGLLAGGGDGGLDIDIDVDVDLDHGDPTEAFKLLSVQSVAAFLMGFGWGGIAGLRGFGWEWVPSMFLGVGVGVAMVWLLTMLLSAMFQMQSSGNVSAESAIGSVGTVYAAIPARGEGRGQVQMVVQGRLRTFTAISDGEPFASQVRVRVVRVNPDRSLVVEAE